MASSRQFPASASRRKTKASREQRWPRARCRKRDVISLGQSVRPHSEKRSLFKAHISADRLERFALEGVTKGFQPLLPKLGNGFLKTCPSNSVVSVVAQLLCAIYFETTIPVSAPRHSNAGRRRVWACRDPSLQEAGVESGDCTW